MVKKMSEINGLSNKLNEISAQLTAVGDLLSTLVNSINSMGQQLDNTMTSLSDAVHQYTDKITTTSSIEFDQRQNDVSRIMRQIETMKEKVGVKPLIESATALDNLLGMVDTIVFDPSEIKLKLEEIKQFIQEQKVKNQPSVQTEKKENQE